MSLMERDINKLAGINAMKSVLIGKKEHNVKKSSHHSNSKKSWCGYYCCVPDCKNTTERNKERIKLGLPKISFHCFPDTSSAKGKMWISKIQHDPGPYFVVNKNTKICSEHFKHNDFVFADLPLKLKDHILNMMQSHQFFPGAELMNACH